MRRAAQFIFLLELIFFAASTARAQSQTTVTATVTDPNTIPYAGGTVKAQISPPGANSPCVTNSAGDCVPIQGTVGPAPLDSTGKFTLNLYPNASITPAATQWTFTVCIAPGVPPPQGTGPQCFSATATIAGASQDVSAALNAVAPALTHGGSGSGGPTLQTNGTNNTVQTTLNFITSTANSTGGTITPSNSTSTEKFELTGTINPTGGGTGLSNPAAHSLLQSKGASNFGLLTAAGYAGVPQEPSCVAGVDCTIAPPGVVPRTDATATPAIVATDRLNGVIFTNASPAATIPAAGTAPFDAGFSVLICNEGSGAATLTPTTSTINGAASQKLPAYVAANHLPPACMAVIADGTNYDAYVISGKDANGLIPLGTAVSGNLPNANLASQTANTVLGALTATTPSGLAVPSCSASASALTWTTGTGFGCNTISASTPTITVANAGTTGTTVNTLTKLTGAPSTAVIAATSDTGGVVGITTAGAGTTGSATITFAGSVSCVFDGATTAGDYVQISSTTGGDCHDSASTYPTSGQVIGRVLSTNAAAGTFTVDLYPSEIKAASGGGAATTVIPVSKTANYTLVAGDFQAATTTSIESIQFTISTSTTVTATLPATAPAEVSSQMPCVWLENSAKSYPFELQINTNSVTLDGTAYGANLIGVDPGKSVQVCSNGTNYVVGAGNLSVFAQSFTQGSNAGGGAFAASSTQIFISTIRVPQATVFGHMFLSVSNPDASNNYSWALYSCVSATSCVSGNGSLLCSVAATTLASANITPNAASACTQGTIVIPPGLYVVATAGAATTATYHTTGTAPQLWNVNVSTTTTTGGVLSTVSTIAIPAAGSPLAEFGGMGIDISLQQ